VHFATGLYTPDILFVKLIGINIEKGLSVPYKMMKTVNLKKSIR